MSGAAFEENPFEGKPEDAEEGTSQQGIIRWGELAGRPLAELDADALASYHDEVQAEAQDEIVRQEK